MSSKHFSTKLERLRQGASPRVLDLFSGCGGISLGFQAAGFKIAGAIEIDLDAAISHAANFPPESSEAVYAHSKPRDITTTEPDELASTLGLGDTASGIDVIVGGPPCQAFARVGRAKLREVDAHPEAFIRDPRGNLYLRYLHYVRAFKPVALMMENVPDVLNYGGHNIAEEMAEVLGDLGYTCRYTLLNAVHYGVPQMRERMFLVAFAKEIDAKNFFPAPTHFYELPRGYEGSRQVALKTLNSNLLSLFSNHSSSFIKVQNSDNSLRTAVTAREAMDDLPAITLHIEGKLKRGARYLDTMIPYPTNKKLSDYAYRMRTWKDFENSEGLVDHVIRYLPRDYNIFERMKPGDQYPEAHKLAVAMFHERITALRSTGNSIIDGSKEFHKFYSSIVPPYDPAKFPNKWRKMESDCPARTLMAHLGKDSYSHIHYDSRQKRTISVREAARLQSFPDGFKFHGTMNPAFRQIGNAVPPLMAKALAVTMMTNLERTIYEEICIKTSDSIRSDLFQMALRT
jgi:DNA (cytosine-5)-methyltransferase 1